MAQIGFLLEIILHRWKKWKKPPKVYKNEAESLPQWELDSERVQRFDFAEVLDWISVRINQGRDDYILQELLKVVSVILNQNIPFSKAKESHLTPSTTGDFTPPLCMLGRPGGSCMFLRTFSGPRRPVVISFLLSCGCLALMTLLWSRFLSGLAWGFCWRSFFAVLLVSCCFWCRPFNRYLLHTLDIVPGDNPLRFCCSTQQILVATSCYYYS